MRGTARGAWRSTEDAAGHDQRHRAGAGVSKGAVSYALNSAEPGPNHMDMIRGEGRPRQVGPEAGPIEPITLEGEGIATTCGAGRGGPSPRTTELRPAWSARRPRSGRSRSSEGVASHALPPNPPHYALGQRRRASEPYPGARFTASASFVRCEISRRSNWAKVASMCPIAFRLGSRCRLRGRRGAPDALDAAVMRSERRGLPHSRARRGSRELALPLVHESVLR